jgi:threonine dehydrogenase-like Zn-dependent dehydrogenase
MDYAIPNTQHAIQLTAPGQLILNPAKPVPAPGPHQILCRVEAVGLCFSDLKLLQKFSEHPRKKAIISGIPPHILKEIPSYAPGNAPTVPGHEAVVRIWAVGKDVNPDTIGIKPGRRYLVQTDYRWLPTDGSNGSFGYNFEGALQEYVLMDERVITSPDGESMLLPAPEELSASSIALIEPWACVEQAYAEKQRQRLKTNGRMLTVTETQYDKSLLKAFLDKFGAPAQVEYIEFPSQAEMKHEFYDDIVYFGCSAKTVEALFPKLAAGGLFNIVLCNDRLDREVTTNLGRIHYTGIRIIGTKGQDPAESMQYIPATGEIRNKDKINIIGAGGPMGIMHVIRNLCQGLDADRFEVEVFAGDTDDARLQNLIRIAAPLAEKNKLLFQPYNPARNQLNKKFNYIVLMVPVCEFVASAVKTAAEKAIINIFAGIPAETSAKINLNTYIEKRLYFIGTSGSLLADMKSVVKKLESEKIDTNLSVAAVCGLDGVADGIKAIENRSIDGKIIAYPCCKGLPLLKLGSIGERLPEVAKELTDGIWNINSEKKLLESWCK